MICLKTLNFKIINDEDHAEGRAEHMFKTSNVEIFNKKLQRMNVFIIFQSIQSLLTIKADSRVQTIYIYGYILIMRDESATFCEMQKYMAKFL